jgi:hypothetical protein
MPCCLEALPIDHHSTKFRSSQGKRRDESDGKRDKLYLDSNPLSCSCAAPALVLRPAAVAPDLRLAAAVFRKPPRPCSSQNPSWSQYRYPGLGDLLEGGEELATWSAANGRRRGRRCSPAAEKGSGKRREAARFWEGQKWDCSYGRAFVGTRYNERESCVMGWASICFVLLVSHLIILNNKYICNACNRI